MRLSIVSHTFATRTADGWLTKNRLGSVVDRLSELGWSVTLLTRESAPQDFLTHRLSGDVTVVPYAKSPVGLARAARELRRSDVGLVFMPTVNTALLALSAGRRAVVYWGAAWGLRTGTPRWRVALEGLVARRAGHVIGSGDTVVASLAEHAPTAEVAVPLVEREVAVRIRTADLPVKDTARISAVFVGSISDGKGVPEVMTAVEQLPEVDFQVIGPVASSRLGAELSSMASARPNLVVRPYLEWPDLRDAYLKANVLVLPSRTEGLARVIHEATAFGAALVVTPAGAAARYLRDEQSALLVPPGDAAALVDAIRQLAREPELIARLNRAACASLAPLFPDDDAAAQFDRSLRTLSDRAEVHA